MIAKVSHMNLLIDFYGPLLTSKQQEAMIFFYHDNLSLSEIAEHFNTSRQAVHDLIKRSEDFLIKYEDKLGLLKSYQERIKLMDELEIFLKDNIAKDDIAKDDANWHKFWQQWQHLRESD